MRRFGLFAAATILSLSTAAFAADTDPADLAFWQSIQSSTNAAEYQAYVDAFPEGKFVALAKIRVKTPPAPLAATAPADAEATPTVQNDAATAPAKVDVGQGEKIVLDPPQLKVGQTTNVTCPDMPSPSSYDKLEVVKAGSPDVDPSTAEGSGVKVLWYSYASSCNANVLTMGPFAPGKYEIRFYSTLYNNDNVLEIATRTAFSVR
jgi:hypothetical protein